MAGKLYHVVYVIRPRTYFVRRLLQLSKLHLNGQDNRSGEGGAWGRSRKKAETVRVLRLTEESMEDVGWWRWCLKEGMTGERERLAAPSLRFVKQTHQRIWFSDAPF